MKYCYSIIILLLAACNSQKLQPNKVPSVVVNSLKAQYPSSVDIDWQMKNNFYEADVDLNDSIDVTVRINETGQILMKKQDVPISELNPAITQVIQERYKRLEIDDVERVEKDGMVYYQVELNRKLGKDIKLVITENGKEENISFWD